jgi:hypothetical protein
METEEDRLQGLIKKMQESMPQETLDCLREIKEMDSQRYRRIEMEMFDEEIERSKRNIGHTDSN